eukprot:TRINITY_DN49684_c0_g1_i1.p1 TRINITY_DN49684_c0_g1~~TRINITY_DN49684_c0_g1_i1.p1  ORF type:complete len:530 (-),score=63.54 TRINITY_DN49684_c0_g1_i1:7-1596(-)
MNRVPHACAVGLSSITFLRHYDFSANPTKRNTSKWAHGVPVACETAAVPAGRGSCKAKVDAVVIGGGVCGLSTALFLSRLGKTVHLIERETVGAEHQASCVNCGILEVGSSGIDSKFPHWFLLDTYVKSTVGLSEFLCAGSLSIYDSLSSAGHEIEFRRTRALEVIETRDQMLWVTRTLGLPIASSAKDAEGDIISVVTPSVLRELEPELNHQLLGAICTPQSGSAHPRKTMFALADEARNAGAVIQERTEVVSIDRGQKSWLVTGQLLQDRLSEPSPDDETTIEADELIVACGGMTNGLLGLAMKNDTLWSQSLPSDDTWVIPVVGQMFSTKPCPDMKVDSLILGAESWHYWDTHPPTVPPFVTHERDEDGWKPRKTRHLYAKQTPEGRLIFGGDRRVHPTQEPRAAHPLPRIVEDMHTTLMAHSSSVLPKIGTLEVERQWGGIMPFSSDGKPIIGEIELEPRGERTPRLFVAGGLAASGFMKGAMTGYTLSELIAGCEARRLQAFDILGDANPMRFHVNHSLSSDTS